MTANGGRIEGHGDSIPVWIDPNCTYYIPRSQLHDLDDVMAEFGITHADLDAIPDEDCA